MAKIVFFRCSNRGEESIRTAIQQGQVRHGLQLHVETIPMGFAPPGSWCSGDGLTKVLQKYLASLLTA
jgi:hypothetical protein